MRKQKKYHYIYKTTCKLNGKYYVGMHSTHTLNDGYLGSGTYLRRAIRKYGKENFEVEFLEFFESRKDLIDREVEMVNEDLIQDPMCMNLKPGGAGGLGGMITVRDKNNVCFNIHRDDPKFISGEVVPVMCGLVVVKDSENNKIAVPVDDPRYLSGELISMHTNNIVVKDKCGNVYYVPNDDPRYLSGELVGHSKGTINVKDTEDNIFVVPVDDPRYLSGELKSIWQDRTHTKETKNKMSEQAKLRVGDKNSQYGTCWIYKLNENKKIKLADLKKWKDLGWQQGRK